MDEKGSPAQIPLDPSVVLPVLTTEHYNLQTMRSGTIAETNGRASIFLGAVSAGLVAIGFTAAAKAPPATFALFVSVILAGLIFLGLTTFTRTVQSSIDDAVYAIQIDAVREAYLEVAPGLAVTLGKVRGRDLYFTAAERGRWQRYVSVSGTIAAITSMLIGAGLGLIADVIAHGLVIAIVVGVVSAVVADVIFMRVQARNWRRSGTITFRGKADPRQAS